MKVERQGACIYCGKQRIVEAELTENQAALDAAATDRCDCPEAALKRGMSKTQEAIKAILGEDAKAKGFDYELDDDALRVVEMICAEILRGNLDRVSLAEPNGDVVKLARNGGAVCVSRVHKRQVTM